MVGQNYDTKVNGGIHGPSNHNPEVIKQIEKWIEEGKRKLPIADAAVYLAGTGDKRWNGKKEPEKCKGCDIAQAGYKTQAMCQGCSDESTH